MIHFCERYDDQGNPIERYEMIGGVLFHIVDNPLHYERVDRCPYCEYNQQLVAIDNKS